MENIGVGTIDFRVISFIKLNIIMYIGTCGNMTVVLYLLLLQLIPTDIKLECRNNIQYITLRCVNNINIITILTSSNGNP